MLAIKTILHPTDFSERSEPAFRLACALARDYGARLVVVHVEAFPSVLYGEGIALPVSAVDQQALKDELLRVKSPDARVVVEHRLFKGDAAAEIVAAAEDTKADIIVMGSHGRTGLARMVLGSVAEKVMRRAPCPVVTVKPPLAQLRSSEDVSQEATRGPGSKA